MDITISKTKDEMGQQAAHKGAEIIRKSIREKGNAGIITATGASQFEMLEHLTSAGDIDWSKVEAFHLDEYIGIPKSHKASFRRYLKERFVDKLPMEIGRFHYIRTKENPYKECDRLGNIIAGFEIDVAFIGIGENGHIAFNDPPADFDTEEPFIVVELDEACRRQQMGEGWFQNMSEVPEKAVTMSVKQIMKSKTIICTVPDTRKADAVKKAVEGPVTQDLPASILQEHPACNIYLDENSAGKMSDYA